MSAVGEEGGGGRVWVWRYCLDCYEVSKAFSRGFTETCHCYYAGLDCCCNIWCGTDEVEEVEAERGSSLVGKFWDESDAMSHACTRSYIYSRILLHAMRSGNISAIVDAIRRTPSLCHTSSRIGSHSRMKPSQRIVVLVLCVTFLLILLRWLQWLFTPKSSLLVDHLELLQFLCFQLFGCFEASADPSSDAYTSH
jgi:hypothetical protein